MGYGKQQRLARWIRFLIGLSAFLLVLVGLLWLAPALASDYHIVRPGENLERIAREYGVNLEDLRQYNDIVNPNHIVIGQQLMLPPKEAILRSAVPASADGLPGDAGYHVVQTGESLSKIARLYGLTTGDLMRWRMPTASQLGRNCA
jgi:LysM repeat protein